MSVCVVTPLSLVLCCTDQIKIKPHTALDSYALKSLDILGVVIENHVYSPPLIEVQLSMYFITQSQLFNSQI